MSYEDEDGFSKSDYKEGIIYDFGINDGFWSRPKNDFQRLYNAQTAKRNGRLYEYIFEFSEDRPATGGYISLLNVEVQDDVGIAVRGTKSAMKFMNQYIGTPSGLGIFNGQGTFMDNYISSDIEGVKPYYIINVKYRERGVDEMWIDLGQPTHGHTARFWFSLVYDESGQFYHVDGDSWKAGQYITDNHTDNKLVWNHDDGDPETKESRLPATLSRALGQEVYQEFFTEQGINRSINWTYKGNDGAWRSGNDEYWITHGFPNGRKYRVWNDFMMNDGLFLGLGGVLFWLLKKTKLLGFVFKQVTKQITRRIGKVPIKGDTEDILQALNSDPSTGDSSYALNHIGSRVSWINRRLKRSYSPQKGVMRL